MFTDEEEQIREVIIASRKLEEYFLWFCESNKIFYSCSSDCVYYNVKDKNNCKKLYINDYILKNK